SKLETDLIRTVRCRLATRVRSSLTLGECCHNPAQKLRVEPRFDTHRDATDLHEHRPSAIRATAEQTSTLEPVSTTPSSAATCTPWTWRCPDVWTLVPLVDDIWELVQEGLAEFVFLIDHDVEVDLDVRLQNLDGLFPANSYLVRAWGPPCTADQTNRGLCGGENPTSGTRPVLLPTGTKFRIRQWGLGFLPIMNEDT